MTLKWIGAALVIAACSAAGFLTAASHRREESTLRHLLSALDYMECELQYRLTPLPDLCRQAAGGHGCVGQVLLRLAEEMERQILPDAASCMNAALAADNEIPEKTRRALFVLGRTLGRFDLVGQVTELEAVRAHCREELGALEKNREERLRSYQTLGLCAGAALAILFV